MKKREKMERCYASDTNDGLLIEEHSRREKLSGAKAAIFQSDDASCVAVMRCPYYYLTMEADWTDNTKVL